MFSSTSMLAKLLHSVWDNRSDLEKQIDAKWVEFENCAPGVQESDSAIQKFSPDNLNKGLIILSEINNLVKSNVEVLSADENAKLQDLRELFVYYCQASGAYKNLNGNELRSILSVQAEKLGGGNDSFGLAALNLLVDLEKQKAPDFDCRVIDIKNFSQSLEEILKYGELANGESKRVQLIVHNRGHYTTVDFKISATEKQCIVLDAANDPRMSEIIVHINKSKAFYPPPLNQQFVVRGNRKSNIQSDYSSCPVFSFDHASQISKMDIYDRLATTLKKEKAIDWVDLPQELIWNVQSKKWVEFYKTQHPNDNLNQLDLRINAATTKTYENPSKRKMSQCLNTTDRLFATYGKKMNAYLAETDDNQLETTFKNLPHKYVATVSIAQTEQVVRRNVS